MASRDEDFGSGLTLVEGDDGIWSPSGSAPAREARDWRSLYEQAHARAERERSRADAAEARAEELRWAEVDSRSRAGSLKWQLDRCRNKLKAAVEETKDVRRTAKNALSLQAEVTRLEKLLSEAGILQAWLTLPSCLASSSSPTLARMIFWSLVILRFLSLCHGTGHARSRGMEPTSYRRNVRINRS